MLKNKQCKDAGFIDVEDEEECKAECEGQQQAVSQKISNHDIK